MSLALRNLLFTIVVPGAGGAYVPWLILTRHGPPRGCRVLAARLRGV